MKKLKTLLNVVALALLLVVLVSAGIESWAFVSPALNVLASNLEMTRSGLVGNNITFSTEDFDNAVGINVSSITILSLPSEAAGVLTFRGEPVEIHQVIRRMDFDELQFVPTSQTAYNCSFMFGVVSSSKQLAIRCAIFILEDLNFSPTLAVPSDLRNNPFEFSTFSGVTHFGILHAIDPENDQLRFEIVSQPRRGVLVMTNYQTGEFMYIPTAGERGRDSFRYNVIDRFGNRSEVATVNVRINRYDGNFVYSDMHGHPAHNAALTLAARGIMSGTHVGNQRIFSPDVPISRAEFLSIIMSAANMSVSQNTAALYSLHDREDIPAHLRYFVAAAVDGRYIGMAGPEQQKFMPNAPITRAEAAVIVTRMINTGDVAPVRPFNDAAYVPAWAAPSLDTLRGAGMMSTRDGYIHPGEYLTRGETAEMALAVMRYFSR
jgi:hypothetical protein